MESSSKCLYLLPYSPSEARKRRSFSLKNPTEAFVRGFASFPKVYNGQLEMWLSYFVEEEQTIENSLITPEYFSLYGRYLIEWLDTQPRFLGTLQGKEVVEYIESNFKEEPNQEFPDGTIVVTRYSTSRAIIVGFNPEELTFYEWDNPNDYPLYVLRYVNSSGEIENTDGPAATLQQSEFRVVSAPTLNHLSELMRVRADNERLRGELSELQDIALEDYNSKIGLYVSDLSSFLTRNRKAARKTFKFEHEMSVAVMESVLFAKLDELRINVRWDRRRREWNADIPSVRQAKAMFPGALFRLKKKDGSTISVQLPLSLGYTKTKKNPKLTLEGKVTEVNPKGAVFSARM